MRTRKRTDERDAEQAMAPVIDAVRRKWQDEEDAAILAQAEWDAFPERRNMLPFLLEGMPGVTVVLLDDLEGDE